MSTLDLLRETVQDQHHTLAHEMAKGIYRCVAELLHDGQRPQSIYDSLDVLYHGFRERGQSLERDAVAEVMDWFDDEGLLYLA